MAIKIKRSLYVGLGGTGLTTLLETKRMIINTFGEVPPMIGFLAIDTDRNAFSKTITNYDGTIVEIDKYEQQAISVKDARPIYDVNKDRLPWLHTKNMFALSSLDAGAGQIRSNGRFAYTVNYEEVEAKVNTILRNIKNAKISENEKYELLGSDVEIHVVFSISGGTGCGTFINMAYLLRKIAPGSKITAYAVLPEVFKAMSRSGMDRVGPNAYGALNDLDYLMHFGMNDKSFTLKYLTSKNDYDIRERPFNTVIFVDNQNTNGDVYNHVDQLAQMIGLALITASGELSTSAASVGDNIEKNIVAGDMDIENKRAWAAGLGVCEIIYKGEELSNIYAIKGAKLIIDFLLNTSDKVDSIVNNWIDSPQVHIRENNNCDHVIDYLHSKQPKFTLTISDRNNALNESVDYLSQVQVNDDDISKKCQDLSKRVREELSKLVAQETNKKSGIFTIENVLIGIDNQVNIFLSEMNSEMQDFQDKKPKIEEEIKVYCQDLAKENAKFFKSKSKIESLENDVIDSTTKLAIANIEIVRRSTAISFYNGLKNEIRKHQETISIIKNRLISVYAEFGNNLANKVNSIGKGIRTFQIDLAQRSIDKVDVSPKDIDVDAFVKTLSKDGLLSFKDNTQDDVYSIIFGFVKSSSKAILWQNKSIEDELANMTDEEVDKLIKTAVQKSLPLFRFDTAGYQQAKKPMDAYYIGVPDKLNKKIKIQDRFSNFVDGNPDIDFASIGGKEHIIIYRQIGVVPVYTLANINLWKDEYNECKLFCHIDANLKKDMDRKEFSIYPKRESDKDILEYWVKGFVFGLIKNEGGYYQMKSEAFGDPLEDNWVKLDKFRDTAFEEFARKRESVKREFSEFFISKEKADGSAAIQVIWDDAKKNYQEKYSQIKLTPAYIKSKGQESIANLLRDEIQWIKHS